MNISEKNLLLEVPPDPRPEPEQPKIYRIRFREGMPFHSAISKIQNIRDNELVMIKTDHGLEPASIVGFSASYPEETRKKLAIYNIVRRANREESNKYANWVKREEDAFEACRKKIEELSLPMKLVRVERFFNGSNIVFYFTADNRVDFRDLVKILVQEFRTRVEMRQVGVRHETKMVGGIGYCGRELCCSSFMKKFIPVSIKMVKEQDLPLNPTKISGVCNRLLCCLTHEFSTYKSCKKGMPKMGKIVKFDGRQYKVAHRNILQETVKLVALDARDEFVVLGRAEWGRVKVAAGGSQRKEERKPGKAAGGKSAPGLSDKRKTKSPHDKKKVRSKGKTEDKPASAKSSRRPRTKTKKTRRPRRAKPPKRK